MSQYVIYKITNPLGQVYIGQTCNYEKRIFDYSRLRCRTQKLLYKSLVDFGFSSHKVEIYKTTTLENCNKDEIEAIKVCDSYNGSNPNGLNLIPGGRGVTYRGHEMPKVVKEAIRATLSGRVRTPEECHNIRKGKLGKKVKRETVEKSAKGRYKGVIQYSLEGNFIKEWESATTASKELGISRNTIFTTCKLKSNHAGGFIWRSKTDTYLTKIDIPLATRKFRNTLNLTHNDYKT